MLEANDLIYLCNAMARQVLCGQNRRLAYRCLSPSDSGPGELSEFLIQVQHLIYSWMARESGTRFKGLRVRHKIKKLHEKELHGAYVTMHANLIQSNLAIEWLVSP